MKNVILNKKLFLFLIISSLLSVFFYKGRLGGDDLQSFNFAFNLIEESTFGRTSLLENEHNNNIFDDI